MHRPLVQSVGLGCGLLKTRKRRGLFLCAELLAHGLLCSIKVQIFPQGERREELPAPRPYPSSGILGIYSFILSDL